MTLSWEENTSISVCFNLFGQMRVTRIVKLRRWYVRWFYLFLERIYFVFHLFRVVGNWVRPKVIRKLEIVYIKFINKFSVFALENLSWSEPCSFTFWLPLWWLWSLWQARWNKLLLQFIDISKRIWCFFAKMTVRDYQDDSGFEKLVRGELFIYNYVWSICFVSQFWTCPVCGEKGFGPYDPRSHPRFACLRFIIANFGYGSPQHVAFDRKYGTGHLSR